MSGVGSSIWNKGERAGIRKERINSTIYYVKVLMKNNYTLDEAILLLNVNQKIAKIARKELG